MHVDLAAGRGDTPANDIMTGEVAMDRRLTRRCVLAASSLLVAGALAGASPQPATAADYPIAEVRWALPAINDTMFVPRAWSTYVGAIMSLVQEGSLAFGDDLSLQPGVTTATQVDPTTYKYKIRKG